MGETMSFNPFEGEILENEKEKAERLAAEGVAMDSRSVEENIFSVDQLRAAEKPETVKIRQELQAAEKSFAQSTAKRLERIPENTANEDADGDVGVPDVEVQSGSDTDEEIEQPRTGTDG